MLSPATHELDAAGAVQPVRSTKAGMLSPATQTAVAAARAPEQALNEGRDVKPGDTFFPPVFGGAGWGRSTKAGMLSPATPGEGPEIAPQLLGAQRRPGC